MKKLFAIVAILVSFFLMMPDNICAAEQELKVGAWENKEGCFLAQQPEKDQLSVDKIVYEVPEIKIQNNFVEGDILKLDFKIADAVIDPDKPVIYMSCKDEKKLYAVNYVDGTVSFIIFDYMPESLEFGKGRYANELYVALLHREHDSSWNKEEQYGTIAIIDRDEFKLKDTINISVDPFDIVAGRDGCLYVPSGSGQWTNLDSYRRDTKVLKDRTMIRHCSYIKLHSTMDKIYTINTDSSPRDFNAYNTDNGVFTDPKYPGGYNSPYNGEYQLNMNFAIDPAGKNIFNGSGNFFSTSSNQEHDMLYAGNLGAGFAGIAFEPDFSLFYTLSLETNIVNIYRGRTLGYVNSVQLADRGKWLFKNGGKLVVVYEPIIASDYITGIQTVNIPDIPPLPEITITSPNGGQILKTWSNHAITWNYSGKGCSSEAMLSLYKNDIFQYVIASKVNLVDNSYNWTVPFTQTPGNDYRIRIDCNSDSAVFDFSDNNFSIESASGEVLGLPFMISDAVADPDKPIIYMSSKDEKKLYAVNYVDGTVSFISFDYMPESLEIGKGQYANELYVALLHREHNSNWWEDDRYGTIAVIDMNVFELKDTINVSVDPYDIVAGRDGCLYVTSGDEQLTYFDSYSRMTKSRVDRANINHKCYAMLHPTIERIYVFDTYFHAYNIANGVFTDPKYPGGYKSTYGGHLLYKNSAIDPAGNYLFNGSGNIFFAFKDKTIDMLYAGKLGTGFTDIAFEPDLSLFYTLPLSNNKINIYRGINFCLADTIQLADKGKLLFKKDSRLVALLEGLSATDYKTGIQVVDLPQIPPLPITITSPNGGECWQTGTVHDITWNYSSGSCGSDATIALYKNGLWQYDIAPSINLSDGSYSWTVPSTQTSGNDYKIMINYLANTTVYDDSDNNFSVSNDTSDILKLPFKVDDAVVDPDRPLIYMTSKYEHKLYSVNYIDGTISPISFDYMPESIELGIGQYSDELYVALLHGEHDYYWMKDDQYGTIAVIDRNEFKLKDMINISVDPCDIVAGRDGYLYVPSGSGQWAYFDSYCRETKGLRDSSIIRQLSYAKLHPNIERIYTVDTDLSDQLKAYIEPVYQ